LVEVKTRYTLKLYSDYFWFSLFRGKYYRYGKAAFPIMTALMILLMIGSFTCTWLAGETFIQTVTSVMSVVCILFYAMALTRPKAYVKRSPILFETGIEFAFHDDSFLTVQTGDIAKGTAITRYVALNKVYETKTMFYIYITPMQALLIAKCDITKGTPEELRNILITKLPAKKYVICK